MSQKQNINQPNNNNLNIYDNQNYVIPNNKYMMNYSGFPQNVPHYPPYGNIHFANNNPNLNTQNQNTNKQNQVILMPAKTPITQVNQNNSSHPTLLGNALIPVLNEKPISASQKYKQIVIYFNSKINIYFSDTINNLTIN